MTPAQRAAALSWLCTREGSELLQEIALLPEDALTRLSRIGARYSHDIVRTAVELLALRARARVKFAGADAMFLTPVGLEQATTEAVAEYRASRFPDRVRVLDAGCGIGGDAVALAGRGPVLAVDRDPAAAVCALANLRLHAEAAARSRVACVDVAALDLAALRRAGIGALFCDPSRRVAGSHGTRRAAHAGEYSPPLSWVAAAAACFPLVVAKVSPAVDYAEVEPLGGQIELVSERGECREATVWIAPDIEPTRRAVVLQSDGSAPVLSRAAVPAPALSDPRAWIYDPDPAVSRAHLVAELAALVNGCQLDRQIAYLTADRRTPTPFARAFRVLDWLPFNLREVQARAVALGRRVTAIKRRGVPLDPNLLRKRLCGERGAQSEVVVALTRLRGAPIAILCEAVHG